MNDLIINVAAGLISGILAPFAVARLGGGTPPPPVHQPIMIDGDGNTIQQIGTIKHEHNIYDSLPTSRTEPLRSAHGDDEPWAMVAGLLVVGAALVLAYMLVWPIVVWALVGAALGLAVATAWIYATTAHTPGPRSGAFLLALISAGLLFLAAWWTLDGGPGSSLSNGALEAKVLTEFPGFNDGVSQRLNIIGDHPVELLKIVGWPGAYFILTQILAMECAVFLIWARTRELTGWVALRNLVDKPDQTQLARRAQNFKKIGASSLALTALLGAILVGTSGGWVYAWIDDMRGRQSDAIVNSR